jgi:hypothetical protein
MNLSLFTSLLLLISLKSNSQLVYRNVLSNGISIKLPASFILMDEKTLSFKYPSNNRPVDVYTDTEATVNIAFKQTGKKVTENDVMLEGRMVEKQLLNTGKITLIQSQDFKVNSYNVMSFSFYSYAIDTKVYNLMFVFSLRGEMIIGSFNCISSLQRKWQDMAYEMIRSIKKI